MKWVLILITLFMLSCASDYERDTSFEWGLGDPEPPPPDPELTIVGNSNIIARYVWNDETVEIAGLSLQANDTEDIIVESVTLNASGSGLDHLDISSVALHRDENSNDVYDPGVDTTLCTHPPYVVDNGTVTLTISQTITKATTQRWLITYTFSGTAQQEATFNVHVIVPDNLTVQNTPTITGSTFYGPDITIRHGSWTPITPTTDAYAHVAIWTGSEMVAWGGFSSIGYRQAIGKYDPSSDLWSPYSTTNAPPGTSLPGIVWTGSDMVVWGGWTAPNPSQNGGVYNLSTDTWQLTTLTSAPSARAKHSMVWTGNEIVVWGGWNTTVAINTGGRYNISGDTWQTTDSSGAPAARYSHKAVWANTASAMVVWGGTDESSNLYNDGGRYYPSVNTWASTSPVGAPSARVDFCCIWTGTEMMIWGGWDNASNYYGTGARYNPILDSWSAITTTNAPSPRKSAQAVWTGSKMIVWGGEDIISQLSDGAIYDPATDTWQEMTNLNAPDKRGRFSAVWAGTEMIVFGGSNDVSGSLNTGAIFRLQ